MGRGGQAGTMRDRIKDQEGDAGKQIVGIKKGNLWRGVAGNGPPQ